MAVLRRRLALALGWAAFLALAALTGAAVGFLPWRGALLRAALYFQAPALSCEGQPLAAAALGRPGKNDRWPERTPAPEPSVAPTPTPAAPEPTAAQEPAVLPATPPPTAAPLPSAAPALADPGKIRAEQFGHGSGVGFVTLAAGSIQNTTRETDAALRAACSGALPFTVELGSSEPQVLILHTHATESYQNWPDPIFDREYAARSTNTALNVCAVGRRMAQVLNEAGIHTLHDETLHDAPGYTESYHRSAETTKALLARYPSIKVVLDVHRDAIEDADGTRVKPVCQIEGEDAAQVMLIAGCDNGSTAPLPNWRLNLRLAAAWESAMEGAVPGLTRPVLCGYRYYNQDLTTGSLLVEVGGHGNTLQEALRAGEYAAKALAVVLAGSSP